ncbi:MAG: aspartyl/asparaginyl beta-hydroxylase domain-containing protein [Myxococcota bacterium]
MSRAAVDRVELVESVSQLTRVHGDLLGSLEEEVRQTEIPWFDSFPDYQSGGWQIASLYNATGEETYDVPQESEIRPTPLAERMPRMRAFLGATGLDPLMVRLTRSMPGSYLYEHADYGGLVKRDKLRLHMPLETNPGAVLSLDAVNVHLQRGFLWKLDPKSAVHGVCNTGDEPRVHLIIDCYINSTLESLVRGQWLDPDCIRALPQMSHEVREQIMAQAGRLFSRGEPDKAEHLLLATFYEYRHSPGFTGYDMILDLYRHHAPAHDRIEYWLDRLVEVYGERHAGRRRAEAGVRPVRPEAMGPGDAGDASDPSQWLRWICASRNLGQLRHKYDQWADTYDANVEGVWGVVPKAAAAMAVSSMGDDGGGILDVGAGTGLMGVALASLGVTQIIGVDLSPAMLAKAADRGVYRSLVCCSIGDEVFRGLERVRCIVATGVFAQNHAGPTELDALADRVEPRGLIVFTARRSFLPELAEVPERRAWTLVDTKVLPVYDDPVHLLAYRVGTAHDSKTSTGTYP